MKLKGYIFSRNFLGERVPQHIQNIVLKDYCNKNNYIFLMSATEYTFSKSTYILFELLDNFKNYDGILFYSLLQLPETKDKRIKIYKYILKKNKELHFASENLKIRTSEEIAELEKVYLLKLSMNENKDFKKIGNLKHYVSFRHKKTKRNYLDRMINNKVKCMNISKKYGLEYWDGDRKYGYGGYHYIKNYQTFLAKKIVSNYNLNKNSKILDIGCGKGFLLYELKKITGSENIYGCDISKYAIKNAKEEVKKNLFYHDIKKKLNYSNNYFDLVLSINVLHNLKLNELDFSLKEIQRIGKQKFICLESYRNNVEQFNLQCWALTAETLIDKTAWLWVFKNSGYTGDYEFIYFS